MHLLLYNNHVIIQQKPSEWFLMAMWLLQVAERAQVLGSGLLAKGCKPNAQQYVGIFAQNRPEVYHTQINIWLPGLFVNSSSVHGILNNYVQRLFLSS